MKSVALALVLFAQTPAPAPLPSLPDARAAIQRQDYAGAERVCRARVAANDADSQAWFILGYALHAQGKLEDALAAHLRAAGFPDVGAMGAYNAACALALLKRPDEALPWLEKAWATGFTDRALMLSDPDLASLRAEARFQALLSPLLSGGALFAEPTRVIHALDGEAASDEFGWVARAIGDLDADHVLDFAATSPNHGGGGRVYVYSGKSGTARFVLDGARGARFGNSVAGGFDANGDGTPDLIVGAPGAGRAFVHSGTDGALLHELAGSASDQFGLKVAGLEDLDGDGCSELAVGAWLADGAAGADCGALHVHSGKSGALLFRLEGAAAGDKLGSAVDGSRSGGHHLLAVGACGMGGQGRVLVYRIHADGAAPAFVIDPVPSAAHLGQYFVSLLGDVDQDGVPDVFAADFGDTEKGPGTGRVYVHSGADGRRLWERGGERAGEGFGSSASVAGDVNGDGRDDVIVGAWQNDERAKSAGKCYLLSGDGGAPLATWTCNQAGDTLGFDAVGLGDVDGDGGHDFLVTSAWSAVAGPKTGRVFVIAGPVFAKAD